MQQAELLFNHVLSPLLKPAGWRYIEIPYPESPAVWIAAAVVVVILMAIGVTWRLITQSKQFELLPEITSNLSEEDWNVVRVSVQVIRNFYPRALVGEIFPMRVASGLRSQPVRLKASAVAHDTISISERMNVALGWAGDAGKGETEPVMQKVRFLRPLLRLDLRTINHPDPNIRLQWRIAILFLVLGWLSPAALSTILKL